MVAITHFQREHIFDAVETMYTAVASCPARGFHFPTGRSTCVQLGYDEAALDALPPAAVEAFAGVGCPLAARPLEAGSTVLDIGSGSGTDALLAAAQVGAAGRVYGLDLTEAMLRRLRENARALQATHLIPLRGNAEAIPLPASSVDVVISNGVINLVPDKARAFAEMFRVLRPGGRLQLADIAIGRDVAVLEEARDMAWLWAECIVGAISEGDYQHLLRDTGFESIRLHTRQDYFAASRSEKTRTVAAAFDAHSVVVEASKPERLSRLETTD